MSCCANCAEHKPCAGLGEPWAISDYVIAGSVIAWGGYIRDAAGTSRWSDRVGELVKQNLRDTKGFSSVSAAQISGWVNQYVSIKVTVKVDFAHLGDVLSTINGAIYKAGFIPDAQSFWVESVPASASGRDDIATPGTGGSTNPGPTTKPNNDFDLCKVLNLPYVCYTPEPGAPTEKSFLDDWADWLGIGQTEAAVIGGLAVIAGIVLVKKLL